MINKKNGDVFDYIYSYTRSQALKDGVLIDVSDTAKEAGFKFPVAVTSAVWDLYIDWSEEDDNQQTTQDLEGRLWDVLWMLKMAIKKCTSADNIVCYSLNVISRDGKSKRAKTIELKAILHGGDEGEPVFSIMLPNED